MKYLPSVLSVCIVVLLVFVFSVPVAYAAPANANIIASFSGDVSVATDFEIGSYLPILSAGDKLWISVKVNESDPDTSAFTEGWYTLSCSSSQTGPGVSFRVGSFAFRLSQNDTSSRFEHGQIILTRYRSCHVSIEIGVLSEGTDFLTTVSSSFISVFLWISAVFQSVLLPGGILFPLASVFLLAIAVAALFFAIRAITKFIWRF